MARREVLRLFPEFKHSLVLMDAYLAHYVECDWETGRCIVAKQVKRPEIPACIAKKVRMKRLKLPPIEDEGAE
jgi:hypothetical protein